MVYSAFSAGLKEAAVRHKPALALRVALRAVLAGPQQAPFYVFAFPVVAASAKSDPHLRQHITSPGDAGDV